MNTRALLQILFAAIALSLLAYNTSIGRLEIGLGSAISVLLFLSVLIIAGVFIKGFRVDLSAGRNS